ncbi:MAG: hypothetical protein ACOYK9_06005 [Chlamydiia bacterium]
MNKLFIILSFVSINLSATTSYIYTTLSDRIDVVNSSTGTVMQTITLTQFAGTYGRVTFSGNGQRGAFINGYENQCYFFDPKQNSFDQIITFPQSFSPLNCILLNDGTVYATGTNGLDISVVKFNSKTSQIESIFPYLSGDNLVQLLADPLDQYSLFNFKENASLLDLQNEGIANIINGENPLSSYAGCIAQAVDKCIFINTVDGNAPTNPIVYTVDSKTKEIIDSSTISFDPGPIPIISRIATNSDGSIVIGVSPERGPTPAIYGSVILISLKGAFPPKIISTAVLSFQSYGSNGSICVNPEGSEAFMFNASNLYTLSIPSGDLNVISNYTPPGGSGPIVSIAILSTALSGNTSTIRATNQLHTYSTLNWVEIFDPDRFEVYRNQEPQPIATLSGSSRSFEDHSGLLPSSSYEYRVVSVWDDGSSSEVGQIILTTN